MNITVRKYFFMLFALLVMVSLVTPGILFAQEENDKQDKNRGRGNGKNEQQIEDVHTDEAITEQEHQRVLLDAFISAQASSTVSTTTAATTTPISDEKDKNEKNTHEPEPFNQDLEDVLNENLPPEQPIKQNIKKETATSSTNSEASPKPATTSAATTSAATTESNINGEQNSFSPNNYYIPLDNLSPEMTYALSFMAMLLGISGGILVIRDPQPTSKDVWNPRPEFIKKPLLEP
jgi:hypothetical protein